MMQNDSQFGLNRKDVRKTTCPRCGGRSCFTLYWDYVHGKIIDPSCGRCDHESGCGYHLTPSEYFKTDPQRRSELINATPIQQRKEPPKIPISKILSEWVDISVEWHQGHPTIFAQWLISLFRDRDMVMKVLKLYNVGGSGHYVSYSYFNEYDPLFWYVDQEGNAIDCKSIQYRSDGHRNKSNQFSIKFYHTKLEERNQKRYKAEGQKAWIIPDDLVLPDDSKPTMCFFGEHLLKGSGSSTIAIVESEKTAIMATLFNRDPSVVWLATGGLSNLNLQNVAKLRGRKVVIFPDRDGFKKWSDQAVKLFSGIDAKICSPMVFAQKVGINPGDLPDNADIADIIVAYLTKNH